MKYCISGRQSASILKQADEIKLQSKDYRITSDYLKDYPKATVILEVDDEVPKNMILAYAEISENFVCCLRNLDDFLWYKQNKVKFYYGFPVDSYYDLDALEKLGVEYVKIKEPLTFDMKNMAQRSCRIRATANVAYQAYIPRENGICGGWIRPEDVPAYEEGIDVLEFEGDINLDQEKTLLHIYKDNQEWPGSLDIIITNLNGNINNGGLPNEFGETRANCKQRCMQNGFCHYCETAFKLSKTLEEYLEEERRNGRR